MRAVDIAIVAEVALLSGGFESAQTAGRKIAIAHRLCSETLVGHQHYDFGAPVSGYCSRHFMLQAHCLLVRTTMFAQVHAGSSVNATSVSPHFTQEPCFKGQDSAFAEFMARAGMHSVASVLRAAVSLKHAQPSEDELALALRATIDVHSSKLAADDVPVFDSIVADVFPGVPMPVFEHKQLKAALTSAATAANLQATPYFMDKCIQLYELLSARSGIMVVGQPFSGKTSCLHALAAALSALAAGPDGGAAVPLAAAVQVHTLYPRALLVDQLYGSTDAATHVRYTAMSACVPDVRCWSACSVVGCVLGIAVRCLVSFARLSHQRARLCWRP